MPVANKIVKIKPSKGHGKHKKNKKRGKSGHIKRVPKAEQPPLKKVPIQSQNEPAPQVCFHVSRLIFLVLFPGDVFQMGIAQKLLSRRLEVVKIVYSKRIQAWILYIQTTYISS